MRLRVSGGAACVDVISIHAPARGATQDPRDRRYRDGYFNPRTREGCDGRKQVGNGRRGNFNPRTREGCDVCRFVNVPHADEFQSTHPRGVRLGETQFSRRVSYDFNPRTREGCDGRRSRRPSFRSHFNPRTREGCDAGIGDVNELKAISIHAPARGATQKWPREAREGEISIHAPARGATAQRLEATQSTTISIHAPARGATAILKSTLTGILISIHAPARGATCFVRHGLSDGEFQSTHPRGVRRDRRHK